MQVVGKYELLSEIGRGATAIVYSARDPVNGEEVCVKLFHPALFSDPIAFQRVQREFEVARLLRHPNIVPIREIIEGKPPALVMNYIGGKNLEDFQLSLPYVLPEISALIILEILNALEYAHEKGVVHRDLKPSNILISSAGSVFVSDFGLARLMGDLTMTGTNSLVGTPDYISPEQVLGDTPSIQSDLFSLGAIFYFLTTGTRPFARASMAATLYAIRSEDPEPPQKRNPKLPAELSRIISKALAKSPEERFQTAREFKQAIEVYLDGLNLGPAHLKIRDWFSDPASSTMNSLSRAAEALVIDCERAVKAGDQESFLEKLAHLSLKAPASPGLSRLTELYQQRLNKVRFRKTVLAGLLVIVIVAGAIGFVIVRGSGSLAEPVVDKTFAPPPEVVAAKPDLGAPAAADRPKAVRPSPGPKSNPVVNKAAEAAPVPATGSVSIRVSPGIQLFWDFREIHEDTFLTGQREGQHELIINRPDYELVRKSIKVTAGQVTEVNVNE